MSLQVQQRLTKRAPDVWDCQAPMRFDWAMFAGSSLARSVPFSSFIYARLVVEPVETHLQVSPNGDKLHTVRRLASQKSSLN